MELPELFKLLFIDLQAIFRQNTRNKKFNLPQFVIISSIPVRGISMTILSNKIGVDNSTLTRLASTLIKDKILIKEKNPNDSRSNLLCLTKKGEGYKKTIEDDSIRICEDILNQVKNEDREDIKNTLSSLHWALSKYKMNI